MAWTLAWPGVTGAIVGARSPAQVDGWLDAATLELTGDDLDAVAAAIAATGAGAGPASPSSPAGCRLRNQIATSPATWLRNKRRNMEIK